MPAARRLAVAAGSLAVAFALVAIPAITLLAPWFAWPANALSDLGVAPRTALAFNATLVATALLGLPYAWAVWDAARERGRGLLRAPAVVFAASLVALAGVGLFPSGTPLHFPAALGFFVGLTATLAADGVVRRATATGRASIALAAAHVAQWWLWIEGVRIGPGLAVPEYVGAAVLAVWVLALSPVAPLAGGREDRTVGGSGGDDG